jgi:hypothetical protein
MVSKLGQLPEVEPWQRSSGSTASVNSSRAQTSCFKATGRVELHYHSAGTRKLSWGKVSLFHVKPSPLLLRFVWLSGFAAEGQLAHLRSLTALHFRSVPHFPSGFHQTTHRYVALALHRASFPPTGREWTLTTCYDNMPSAPPEATESGQFEDCARKMYPEYTRLNVPTWVIGPALGGGPEMDRPADILKVWPKRTPIKRLKPDEFNPIIDRLATGHCTPANR